MAVFTVLSLSQVAPPILETKIKAVYPNDHFPLGPGKWLVVSDGIAKNVSDKLGLADGTAGIVAVFAISGYYGFAPNSIWEWLAQKFTVKNA